ncbi:superoxide dismutase [Ni] [Aeoliella sp.]|uniref:superoxide dismutase [Ni] n=1 Tax=Aeoliella sp. TaxID=2795800 RepID=UPI003CCC3AFE
MITRLSTIAAASVFVLFAARQASAHCQVPCGIYGDERRFEEMLEDTQTIAKAITSIDELAGTHDATGHNQLARWVATKEAHASNIQEIIGQYFLAQRIKADSPKYVEQLKAAHAVIVAAMKCKQAADPATAKALETAILNLYRAYEGKEPQFSQTDAAGAIPASAHAGHDHGDHAHEHGDHDHGHDHGDHEHGDHKN